MNARARSFVIAVAVVAVVVAVIVVAVNSSGGGSTGLSVNGHDVSLASINNQLEGLAGSSYFQQAFSANNVDLSRGPGSVNSAVGAYLVALQIQNAALAQELAAQGLTVTNQDLAGARRTLSQAGFLKGMPSDLQDEFVTLEARLNRLRAKVGSDGVVTAVKKRLKRAQVVIDPRYGIWNKAKLGVCAPTGCRQVFGAVPQPATTTTTPSG
jgi:hypothetical protein